MSIYAGLNLDLGCLQRGHRQSSGRSSKATPFIVNNGIQLQRQIYVFLRNNIVYIGDWR